MEEHILGELLLSYDYPHGLMMHISSILKEKKKSPVYLQEREFAELFEKQYLEVPHEVMELNLAYQEGIIAGFISNNRNPVWQKRGFLSSSLSKLVRKMYEYEAVELLESLMFLFHWDWEMHIVRKWETPEEEKAWFHLFARPEDISEENFEQQARKYIEFQNQQKRNMSRQKIDKRNIGSVLKEDIGEESAYSRDRGVKSNIDGGQKGNTKDMHTIISRAFAQEGKEKAYKSAGRIALSTVRDSTMDGKEWRANQPENIEGKNTLSGKKKDMKRLISEEVLIIEELSEEEYKKELSQIQLKHEWLMRPSIKRDAMKAKRGDPIAQNSLGEYYAEPNTEHTDYREAVRWYGYSARQGNQKAKFEIGRIFDSGRIKGEQTKKLGIHYFQELAKEGYPTAQCILGMKYYLGDGVRQNMAKAIHWLTKAAYQGSVDAQRQLGDIYVDTDKEEAKKWYQKAAVSGDAVAERRLRQM